MKLQRICLVFMLAVVSYVHTLPVEVDKRAAIDLGDYDIKDGDGSNDVDPDSDYSSDEKSSPLNFEKIEETRGCKITVTKTYNETVESYDFETDTIKKSVVERNVTAKECCPGYNGTNCDNIIGQQKDSPCGNITCMANPLAHCALIKRCGVDIPLFVDDMGIVVKECLPKEQLCMGVCKADPCKGLTCDRYPDAMCFSSGCSCKPVWLLPSKVRVYDCSLKKRHVRQADTQCLPS